MFSFVPAQERVLALLYELNLVPVEQSSPLVEAEVHPASDHEPELEPERWIEPEQLCIVR